MLNDVIKLARRAGAAILAHYTDEIAVTRKVDHSPLTQADLAAHRVIVAGLGALDPDTPVISEESGIPPFEQRADWERFWIVDPLDGTKEFIKRNGEFTVNIALVRDGEPVLGVVYAPVMDVSYYAERGDGAWKREGEGEPVRIHSTRADPTRPLVVAASRSHGSPELEDYLAQFEVRERITAGSSLKFCLVAEGTADIYPRFGPTHEWDVAAGDCVYRHSAREGTHASPLSYNKPTFKNEGFVIGF